MAERETPGIFEPILAEISAREPTLSIYTGVSDGAKREIEKAERSL